MELGSLPGIRNVLDCLFEETERVHSIGLLLSLSVIVILYTFSRDNLKLMAQGRLTQVDMSANHATLERKKHKFADRDARKKALQARNFSHRLLGEERNECADVYYNTIGNKDSSEKVVWIQGITAFTTSQDPQAEALAKEFEVLVLDNRGAGLTECKTSKRITTRTMAKDVVELCDYLDWSKFHVVGFSMGGMIAQEVAMLVPERLLSLSLVSTHSGSFGKSIPRVDKMIGAAFFSKSDPIKNAHETMSLLYSKDTLKDPVMYKKLLGMHADLNCNYGSPTDKDLSAQTMAVLTHHASRKELRKLAKYDFPKLVITGDKDVVVRPGNSTHIAKYFGVAPIIVQNTGHMVITSRPDTVNRNIIETIRKGASIKGKSQEPSSDKHDHPEL